MMVLKKVGVWSAARISGILYGAMGLVIGAILAMVSLVTGGIAAASQAPGGPPPWLLPLLGVGAVAFLPLFYGLMGLVTGAICAALYNLFAKVVGGVEFEIE